MTGKETEEMDSVPFSRKYRIDIATAIFWDDVETLKNMMKDAGKLK